MFPKLLVVILALGITACSLLASRQQRIEAAHEAALLHERLIGHERAQWKLRSEIASRCRPDEIRSALSGLGGSWSPLLEHPGPQKNHRDTENTEQKKRILTAETRRREED